MNDKVTLKGDARIISVDDSHNTSAPVNYLDCDARLGVTGRDRGRTGRAAAVAQQPLQVCHGEPR